MSEKCGVISIYSLTCYMERLKKRLRYLAKKRTRQIRKEETKKLNDMFKKYQKRVYTKFQNILDDDPDDLKPIYKEKGQNETRKYFEDPQAVVTFWSSLWEANDTGSPHVAWLQEFRDEFAKIVPEVYEGNLDVTNKICFTAIKKKKNWTAAGPDKIVNYWWKKLRSVQQTCTVLFFKVINVTSCIERWLTEGRVALIPKEGEWSEANQRPITCLNTMYKWITSILLLFHKEHLKKYKLLQIDQRGAREKTAGTVNNLMIDDVVLRDAVLHRRNLFCYWIDVKKAFDSVSHGWLIEMLLIHRFPTKLVNLFKTIMKNWSVKIKIPVKDGEELSRTIHLLNGILQGDSYCPDLYTLTMNVVSWRIRASEGYTMSKPITRKITHTLFIDDLKGYVMTLIKLIYMLNLIYKYMKDAGLYWNPKKCKFMGLKRGKFHVFDNITLEDGTVIKCLKEGDDYEFMGVPQNIKMNVEELASELLKIVQRRSYIIWSSNLSDVNKCKASNQFVNSAVEYFLWAIKFPINSVREMDTAIRKSMNENGCKHTNQINDLNYIPRRKGGRGLSCLEETYKNTKIKLVIKLMESNDQRLDIVKEFHKIHSETNSYSVITEASNYATEVGLHMQLVDENLVIKDVEKDDILGNDVNIISKLLRRKREQNHVTTMVSSKWQGVNLQHRIDDENVKKDYFDWLSNWSSCPSGVVIEFFLFFYQLLPTKCYTKFRSNEVIEDTICRLCGKDQESAKHIISNCEHLAKSLYKTRHDNAFKCFVWPLLEQFGMITKCPPWYSANTVKPHYIKDGCQFYWDSPEYTGRDEEAEHPPRPDGKLIIDGEEKKMIYLLEITIPWMESRKEKYDFKCNKYKQIISSLKFENPGFEVDQVTLVMDVFGGYDKELLTNIGKVIEEKGTVATIVKNMQKSVISSVANLSRTFKIRTK